MSASEPFGGKGGYGYFPHQQASQCPVTDGKQPERKRCHAPETEVKPAGEYVTVTVGARVATDPNPHVQGPNDHRNIDCDSHDEQPEAYSPLLGLSNEPHFSAVRKGHKVMVGHNGWLDRPEKPGRKPSPPKKAGFFDAVKRMAKEVVRLSLHFVDYE